MLSCQHVMWSIVCIYVYVHTLSRGVTCIYIYEAEWKHEGGLPVRGSMQWESGVQGYSKHLCTMVHTYPGVENVHAVTYTPARTPFHGAQGEHKFTHKKKEQEHDVVYSVRVD